MQSGSRFSTLDGIRGLAAVSVLLFHSGQAFGSGYLGVDLFFMLSGFVLSQAYHDRLRAGMPLRRFAALRLVRVYPMWALGALLGIVLQGGSMTMLLFPGLDPANLPLWSLLYELLINLAWAAAVPYISDRVRLGVLAATGAFVAWGITVVSLGWMSGPDHLALTIARVTFSYTLGCQFDVLFRRQGAPRRETWLAVLPLIALAPLMAPVPANRIAFELLALFVALPAIVWMGVIWHLPRPGLVDILGRMSFPLYCIHAPIIMLTLGTPTGRSFGVALVLLLALALGPLDAPAQRFLRRTFGLDSPRASALATS